MILRLQKCICQLKDRVTAIEQLLSNPTDAVLFGSTPPTVNGTEEDGDIYFITSNGTSTGTILTQYIYDKTTNTWLIVPTSSTTTNALIKPTINTIQSIVNGIASVVQTIVSSVVLSKPTVNTLQVAVNGVLSGIQNIISSITSSWDSITGLLTFTVNGVSTTVTIPRVSQAFPLADGVNDTRTGSIGTAGTNIFAAGNHVHPVTKLSPFATPPTITFAGFTAPTGTVNLSYDTESGTEETINYFYQGSLTIPNAIARRNFTISNVAGFRFKSRVTNLYRLSAMAGYPGTNTMEKGQACDKYGNSATTYLYNASTLPGNVVNISTFRVEVTYTLI